MIEGGSSSKRLTKDFQTIEYGGKAKKTGQFSKVDRRRSVLQRPIKRREERKGSGDAISHSLYKPKKGSGPGAEVLGKRRGAKGKVKTDIPTVRRKGVNRGQLARSCKKPKSPSFSIKGGTHGWWQDPYRRNMKTRSVSAREV